jgi:hypothetical protein
MNKTNLLVLITFLMYFIFYGQENASEQILKSKEANKVTIGMYGQIDYNEPEGLAKGKMDVHRMVMLLGYNFNDKVQFLTEIEYEHVKELYVEQAFLNYKVTDNFNVKAGLMLVPMGIINEYHESPTFLGVERPSVDHDIVPTTWREIGVGFSGKVKDMPLKYQVYIFNGFKTDGLRGKDGLRKGRQKGAKSIISSPTFSAKLDYYGIYGLRLGLSGYFGRTQTLSEVEVDGETIGVSMIGLDARYSKNRFKARAQYIMASLSDTENYNTLYSQDLGSKLNGWYVETGYNVLASNKKQKLIPFIRYEQYDTHAEVEGISKNDAYNRKITTFGVNYEVAPGVAYKVDYQLRDDKTYNDVPNMFNMGIAIWF